MAAARETIQVQGSSLPAPQAAHLRQVLEGGGVVGFPTESFYGLAIRPEHPGAAAALLALKQDREGKPIALVLSGAAAANALAGKLPAAFDRLAAAFWPGPLTLVVPARPGAVRPALLGGATGIGLRLPAHPLARLVAELAGGAVTATSANPGGAPPPTRAEQVAAYFGARLDLLLDGGPTPGGAPSTVLDLTRQPARLVRAGAIARAALAAIVAIE